MSLIEPTTTEPAPPSQPEPGSGPRPSSPPQHPLKRVATGLSWTARLLFALFLFVGALQLMRVGASSLDILQPGGFLVRNPGSTLRPA